MIRVCLKNGMPPLVYATLILPYLTQAGYVQHPLGAEEDGLVHLYIAPGSARAPTLRQLFGDDLFLRWLREKRGIVITEPTGAEAARYERYRPKPAAA